MSEHNPPSPEQPQYPMPMYYPAPPPKKKRWPWIVGIIAAMVLIGTVSSNDGEKAEAKADTSSSDSKPKYVTEGQDNEPTEDEVVEDEVVENEPEVVDENIEEEEPEDEMFRVGEVAVIGDWEVKITHIDRDANAEIANANMFNDRAKGVYVMVTYNATYTGDQRLAEPFMDLTWTFTTPDGKVQDEAWAVTPADDQGWAEKTRKGGTIPVQVAFDVRGQVGSSILSVEDYDYYADFQMAP